MAKRKHLFRFYESDGNDRWFDHESKLSSMDEAIKEGYSMFSDDLRPFIDEDGDDITVYLTVSCVDLARTGRTVCDSFEEDGCPQDCDGFHSYVEITDVTAYEKEAKIVAKKQRIGGKKNEVDHR